MRPGILPLRIAIIFSRHECDIAILIHTRAHKREYLTTTFLFVTFPLCNQSTFESLSNGLSIF
jgi:hypothetical protein